MTFTYDPIGRLSTVTTPASTVFQYDSDRLMVEYDPLGAVLRRYVHGPGVDEPLVWYEGAGTTDRRWLHQDRQGSIIAYSDSAGSVSASTVYKYGPWGEPGDAWGAGSRFRYTGQIAIPEARLYHYKARMYDPATGRFMQTDPIGYQDDLDLYAYVGGDPVNRTDPSGLMPLDLPKGEEMAQEAARASVKDVGRGGVGVTVDAQVVAGDTQGTTADGSISAFALNDGAGKASIVTTVTYGVSSRGATAAGDQGRSVVPGSEQLPGGKPTILGGSIGPTFNVSFTGAGNGAELGQTDPKTNGNGTTTAVGFGPFAVQYTRGDNGVPVLSLGWGPSLSFSFTQQRTNTIVLSDRPADK